MDVVKFWHVKGFGRCIEVLACEVDLVDVLKFWHVRRFGGCTEVSACEGVW